MTSATYTTESAKFSRNLIYVIKITTPGDVAGSQVFYFSLRNGPSLAQRLGTNIKPTVKTLRGRTTRIKPEDNLTERANMDIQFFDEPSAEAFSGSVFSVTTGGTFWQRLICSQPTVDGWGVEVSRGFDTPGFVLSDLETFFKGVTYNISFSEQREVILNVKSILQVFNRRAPGAISDGNNVQGQLALTDSSFTVADSSEITPLSSFATKDLYPLVLRLNETEDVIVKSVSANVITVQDNYIASSEDFTTWTPSASSVTSDQDFSPFGGAVISDSFPFVSGRTLTYDSSLASGSNTITFSVWMKRITGSGTITATVSNAGGAQTAAVVITPTLYWARYSVSKTFAAAAGNVRIVFSTSTTNSVYLYGAQLEISSSAGFYVATNGSNSGATAGRAAFGSTSIIGPALPFKEVVIYRNHLTEEGCHPGFIIQDLLSRGGLSSSLIDTTSFGTLVSLSLSNSLRRGRSSDQGDSTIVDSSDISTLLKEVRENTLIDIWESETGLVRVGGAWYSYLTTDTRNSITDEAYILSSSTGQDYGADERLSRIYVYWNKILGTDGSKPSHFSNINIQVNTTGESVGGQRAKPVYSQWIYRSLEATSLGGRLLALYLYGARKYTFALDVKDDITFKVGDLFEVNSDDILVKSGGAALRTADVWRILQKTENQEKGTMSLEAMRARNKKYGLIAPTGTGNYDSVSAAEKKYVFIADTNDLLGAANDPPYVML